MWLHYSGRLYWTGFDHQKSFKRLLPVTRRQGHEVPVSSRISNASSSDWLKSTEVGPVERGWSLSSAPVCPSLRLRPHTSKSPKLGGHHLQVDSILFKDFTISPSLSLSKVSLCWDQTCRVCRCAGVKPAASFYILLFKFLYCVWKLKLWACLNY